MEEIVEGLQFSGLPEHFWGAIQIYTEKSHILNRKICGSAMLKVGICAKGSYKDDLITNIIDRLVPYMSSGGVNLDELDESNESPAKKMRLSEEGNDLWQLEIVVKTLQTLGFDFSISNASDSQFSQPDSNLAEGASKWMSFEKPGSTASLESTGTVKIPWDDLVTENTGNKVAIAVIKKVQPKQCQKYSSQMEIVILDGWKFTATFITRVFNKSLSPNPRVNYCISLRDNTISLTAFKELSPGGDEADKNVDWLKKSVLPKLLKWALEFKDDGKKPQHGSLNLIDILEYNDLYQNLKVKYGHRLVDNWTESTDPKKFVYEDVAIASYLILLWRKEREIKGLTDYQTFVDLGCGNGLLVYILSGEGHRGIGIDLKKRNIWDLFPEHTELQEGVIEPSDKHLFPEYDWLIGNHSDELTPWLPVIAAKSRFTTRFFVIPCCAHDFDCKYKRSHAGLSQYADYIEYIKEVGTVCGFKMLVDKLRIPSTKRVCLIGQERTYNIEEMPQVLKEIDMFIKRKCEANARTRNIAGHHGIEGDCHHAEKNPTGMLWSPNFKARNPIQPVRNCTALKGGIRENLISNIVSIILEEKNLVEVDVGSDECVVWDQGGSINLSDLIKRVGPDQLSGLKKECGGLQTLLKNHRHIFYLKSRNVSLQVPVPEWKACVPKDRIKTKCCWFYDNHYQKCPLPKSACIFAHGEDDIRKANLQL